MKFYQNRRSSQRSNERLLAVEGGQVVCPRRGMVDIEDCWICPAYRGLGGGSVEGVFCSTEPTITRFATTAIE